MGDFKSPLIFFQFLQEGSRGSGKSRSDFGRTPQASFNEASLRLSPRAVFLSRFLKQLNNAKGYKKTAEKLREYVGGYKIKNDETGNCTENSKKSDW